MQAKRSLNVTRRRVLRLSCAAAALLPVPAVLAATAAGDPWQAVRDGRAFAMIRHALAPGTGDGADFDIADCSTQRNLNDAGRRQAERLGDLFRSNGIAGAEVVSSAWCRCRDTAVLMALGEVSILPPLNSFFRTLSREAGQTDALKNWLAARQSSAPLVMVTHQVNITALTGIYPQSGEIIFVANDPAGEFGVLARVATNP